MTKELAYDDISLFSREISEIKSRFDNTIRLENSIIFGFLNKIINVTPIISSPMLDVTGVTLSKYLLDKNCIAVNHRFSTIDEWIDNINKIITHVNENELNDKIISISVGVNDYEARLETFIEYIVNNDVRNLNIIICIDTANGANHLLKKPCGYINELAKNITYRNISVEIMAGNITTKEHARFLYEELGVKFIRVGVSLGSACSTSVVTGIYRPPVNMLIEISEDRDKNNHKYYIVADGGIKNSGDASKAFACGADFIMMGSFFSGYSESNSDLIIDKDGNDVMKYRGMASEEMALLNNSVNSINKKILPEGESFTTPFKGSINNDFEKFINGIKSCFSYCNSKSLKEFQLKVEVIEITNNGLMQRKPHYNL